MVTNSLRSQLLAGLLIPLGIVALVQFLVTYRTAELTAQVVTDRILLASARSIAEQVGFEQSAAESFVPPSALAMFDLGYGDAVYYQVTRSDGGLVAGHPDLPSAAVAPGLVPVYYDSIYHGEPIRLVSMLQLIPGRNGQSSVHVIVAESLNGRNVMSRELWSGSAVGQCLLVVIACVLSWSALKRILAPLLRLGDEVRDREPNEFRPFGVAALQAELEPLVNALNAYMLRLAAQLDAQRRFTANAAHQLRTPLTLLRMQASYALRSTDEAERSEATRAILTTTAQITRLSNQLLSLSKAEPQGQQPRRDLADLVVVTRAILEEHGRLAVDRNVDLAFEVTTGEPAHIVVDPTMLRDLIGNLVDNAFRYTPDGGRVTVRVQCGPPWCSLCIEDTGPGIPPAMRSLVFERFYRVPGTDSEGSGLGLAIVKEILDAHGGVIDLGEGAAGTGLLVTVRLPRAVDAPLGADVAERRRTPFEEPVLGER